MTSDEHRKQADKLRAEALARGKLAAVFQEVAPILGAVWACWAVSESRSAESFNKLADMEVEAALSAAHAEGEKGDQHV